MKLYVPTWKWYPDGRNSRDNYKRLRIEIKYGLCRDFISFKPVKKVTDEQWELICKKKSGKSITKNMISNVGLSQDDFEDIFLWVGAMERRISGVLESLKDRQQLTIKDIKVAFKNYMPATRNNLSVVHLFEEYVSKLEKPKTREVYNLACRSFCKFYEEKIGGSVSNFLITDITSEFLQQYTQYMQKTSAEVYKRHLRAIYNFAKKKNLIHATENPFAGSIKKVQSKNIALNIEQTEVLFNLQNLPAKQQMAVDFMFLCFMFYGANFADIARLKWSNITKVEGGIDVNFKRQKTKSKSNLNVVIQIRGHYERWNTLVQKYSTDKRGKNDYVFYFLSDITQNDETTIGNKVETEKRKLLNALDKVCEKYNLPAVNFNCMRHTFATHAYFESKCDLYSVCQALGHTDIKTTQNYLDSIVLSGDKNPITKATESLISKFLKDEHAKRD